MPTIAYQDQTYDAPTGRSVLDVLLDHGRDIPFACGMGDCLTCMMRCTEGAIPKDAQFGLSEEDIIHGNFLACCCFPQDDLVITSVP